MPQQVTTGFALVKSNQPVKNNGGTVVMAGAANTNPDNGGNISNSVDIPNLNSKVPYYGPNIVAAVSPNSSGNTGLQVIVTSAKIAYQNPGFIMIGNNKVNIANGTAGNTILQTGGGDVSGRKPLGRYYGSTRYNYTGFNIGPDGLGKYSHGSEWGTNVLASGINGVTGQFADLSVQKTVTGIPAKFTFSYGNPNPLGVKFSQITNP